MTNDIQAQSRNNIIQFPKPVQLDRESRIAEQRKRDQLRAERIAIGLGILDKFPDAPAVIVADFYVDNSDPISDYYGGQCLCRVVLGISQHKRNLFPEMRAAIQRVSQITADTWLGIMASGGFGPEHPATVGLPALLALSVVSPDVEHRETYSMGAGFYLGRSRYDGWRVHKVTRRMGSFGELVTEAVGAGLHLLDVGAAKPV